MSNEDERHYYNLSGLMEYEPELEDEEEPEAEDYDPGSEVDDEGGMSEYRHYADWAEVDRAEYEREAGT